MSTRRPRPVRSRSKSAARIPEEAIIPAVMSASEAPTLVGGTFGRTGESHPAGFALHDGVVAGERGQRAVLPVGRHRAPDHAGAPLEDLLGGKPEPREGSRAEVLDEDIGPVDEELQVRAAAFGLEIDRDALLAPVHREEVGALSPGERGAPAPGVVSARRLHLDDLGAEVGQHHRGVRPGENPREIHHPHSGERRAGRGQPRRRTQRNEASAAESARSRSRSASRASPLLMLSGGEIRTQFP